jgi:hypothetical protein
MDGKTARSLLVMLAILLAPQRLGSAETDKSVDRATWPALDFRPLRIAPETTYFTGPLDANGDVDYVAALNQHYSQGVTAENNAVVPLLRAFGPTAIDEKYRETTYRALGMKPLPEQGEYFQSFRELIDEILEKEYQALLEKAKRQNRLTDEVKWKDPKLRHLFRSRTPAIEVQLRAETRQAWRSEDSPLVAAWLKRNERPLDVLAAVPKRPRWFAPYCGAEPPNELEAQVNFRSAVDRRMAWFAAEALMIRCRLHLGEDRPVEACRDAMLAVQLGEAQAQSRVYNSTYYAARAKEHGLAAMESVFEEVALTSADARGMLSELRDEALLPTLANYIGLAERCSITAAFPLLSKHGISMLLRDADDDSPIKPSLLSQVESLATQGFVDWEAAAACATRYLDALEKAAAIPGSIERKRAFEKILPPSRGTFFEGRYRELQQFAEQLAPLMFDPISRRRLLTRRIAEEVVEYPMYEFYFDEFDRGNYDSLVWSRRAIRIGLALAAYRHDHGEFPATLDAIAPGYLKTVPLDPCTNKPLVYRRQGTGYVFYSVGANGKDDGARASWEEGRCEAEKLPAGADDIWVRVSGTAYAPKGALRAPATDSRSANSAGTANPRSD